MTQHRAILVTASVVLLSVPPGAAQTRPFAADSAAIAAAGRAFSAAYVRNDTAAIGQLYADSALLLPPGREIRGRAAIQRYFAWGPNRRLLAHHLEVTSLTISGALAIDVGRWTSTAQQGEAAPTTASERYLVVWQRGADGRWRMLYDMWHRPSSP